MLGQRQVFAAVIFTLVIAVALPAIAQENKVVAVFELKGPLSEAPDGLGLNLLLTGKEPISMFDLLNKLREARKDKSVKAIVLELEESALGLAQAQELRAQFKSLKAAGKDILVYCETLHDRTLLLGSAASELVLMPKGEVAFVGMYGENMYFKNLLDKIGCQADIIHCGAYKSAGEPLYRTGPSPEAAEQTNRILDSYFEQIVADIANSRELTKEKVRELIDTGLFSAQEALEAKLVDKLAYREDFVADVKKRYGEGTKVVYDYGKKQGPTVDLANPFAIFQIFGDMAKGEKKSDKPAIAIIYVEGTITSGESEPGLFDDSSNAGAATIRKAIAQAAADDSVKAMVLRVNSPGGSAIASEVICEATKRFKASERPFIVSMGNVAGSGGYYVACLGDTIFAEPGTLTGSIGVVGGKIVTKGLWDWVGVTTHEYKRGARSDIMNNNRLFNDSERKVIEDTMNRVYGEFKSRVTEGRGQKIKSDLETLAGGRVYTGQQALDIGLVDRLGGFADAIRFAAKEADLSSSYELRVFPRPKSIFEILSEAFGSKQKEDKFITAAIKVLQSHKMEQGLLPTTNGILATLRTIDPVKTNKILDFLTCLHILKQENVLLIGDDYWLISR